MKRRFNYTNRIRISRDRVRIALKDQGALPPAFDASLDLTGLGLAADARVFVEAYYRAAYMRFDFGTVGSVGCDQDRTLRDIDNRELIYFRVKVTDANGEHGKLLAEADGLIANPAEGTGHNVCILDVKYEDLENLAWNLELDDGSTPTLVVNRKISNREYVRSDTAFFALVYPAVIREILTFILLQNDHEYEPGSDDWEDQWISYVRSLPGIADPPNEGEEIRNWIDQAVRSFCSYQPACQLFLDSLLKEIVA
jgi:hypothetical protein